MNDLEAKQKFVNFNENELVLLIKILCNNPLVDFNNAISLTIQGLQCQFREPIEYELNDYRKENLIEYFNDLDIYKFAKTNDKKLDNSLYLNQMKEKWTLETNMKVYVNCEVDDTKKNAFINDNILWLSDMITDNMKAYYIVKTYADLCIPSYNLAIKTLIHIFIDYFFFNNDFKIPKVIYYTDRDVMWARFNETFIYYKKVLFCFIKKFVNLNDLINILNNNFSNVSVDKEILSKLIQDCKIDNLPDFPYYFY